MTPCVYMLHCYFAGRYQLYLDVLVASVIHRTATATSKSQSKRLFKLILFSEHDSSIPTASLEGKLGHFNVFWAHYG